MNPNEETELGKRIRAAITARPGVRVFRNNVGTAWQGQVKNYPNRYVEIQQARPVHFGLCEGSSDFIGWATVEITPEMVGRKVAVFTSIEAKVIKGGNGSAPQKNWLAVVRAAGGIAGIARTPAEADALVNLPFTGVE